MKQFWVACLGSDGKGVADARSTRRDVKVCESDGAADLKQAKAEYSALESWPQDRVLILGVWPADTLTEGLFSDDANRALASPLEMERREREARIYLAQLDAGGTVIIPQSRCLEGSATTEDGK